MIAQSHPKAAARLAALRSFDILDTPREEVFDEVVRLVSDLCEAPISVINLIDADRQWFKAEVGLGVCESPLDTSICSHVILENDFVEIPDTLNDPRTADNPLCLASENGLRFYAGAILKTADGLPIGTLCVLDHKPRTLTPLQRETLAIMARQVMRQLELRREKDRHDTLRREVDHRVKNSLSTVCALIRMQEATAQNPETKQALKIVQNRVQTVVALHRELHHSDSESTINLKRFMNDVCKQLQAGSSPKIDIQIDFDPMIVGSSLASSYGMIVNEFISNSLKHGFAGGRAGRVRLTGRELPDGRFEVTGEDDGAGSATAAETTHGLGLKIMRASADQLGAELDFAIEADGAKLRVIAPKRHA